MPPIAFAPMLPQASSEMHVMVRTPSVHLIAEPEAKEPAQTTRPDHKASRPSEIYEAVQTPPPAYQPRTCPPYLASAHTGGVDEEAQPTSPRHQRSSSTIQAIKRRKRTHACIVAAILIGFAVISIVVAGVTHKFTMGDQENDIFRCGHDSRMPTCRVRVAGEGSERFQEPSWALDWLHAHCRWEGREWVCGAQKGAAANVLPNGIYVEKVDNCGPDGRSYSDGNQGRS